MPFKYLRINQCLSFSSDLRHFFGCDLEKNQTGVLMKGKGPHYLQYSHDTIRIHSLMIYNDIIEDNIVGDTKTPLFRCIPFISKVKSGDIISTGQYNIISPVQIYNLKNSQQTLSIALR